MDSAILAWVIPIAAAIISGGTTWLGSQYWQRRSARRQALLDAGESLKEKKSFLEIELTKENDESKKELLNQSISEVNTLILGFHNAKIKRTLKEAGVPSEEVLMADGINRLQPQQIEQLKGDITEIQALPQSDSVQDLMALASANYYAGQYEEAKSTLDRILDMEPDDPDTLTNRGVTYDSLERYDGALADYNRSLELGADDPTTLTNRGVTYRRLERYDEALADYNRSLELRPDHPDTITNRGNTYDSLERYDESLTDLNRSLELRPDDAGTFTNRGVTLDGLGRYDEALADYDRSLELRPDQAITLTNRGITYSKLERYEEALVDHNRSLELKPGNPITFYNIACTLALQNNPESALDYLERAIKGDEKSVEMAKADKDFDNIREDPRFRKLIGLD